MNSYSTSLKIIEDMAKHLGINRMPSEKERAYLLRVIYSASALMGLAACHDINDDDEETSPKTVSILHVNKRIKNELMSLCKIYSIDDINYDELVDEIISLYRFTGFYYHKDKRVAEAKRYCVTGGKAELLRSPSLSEEFFMSGAGYYRVNDSTEDEGTDISMEAFGLEDYHLKDVANILFDDLKWDAFHNDNEFEFFNNQRKIWISNTPKKERIFFGKRRNQNLAVCYLFRRNDSGKLSITELPNLFNDDINLAFYGYWFHEGKLPKIRFSNSGDCVIVKTGYSLPKSERYFLKLLSWPVFFAEEYGDKYCRIINKNVFDAFQVIMERKGYQFEERL